MASNVFPSELYDASIAWIQNSILTAVVDDFFECGGSPKELRNFITLIEKYHILMFFDALD
jgi:ent-kaurene synthase